MNMGMFGNFAGGYAQGRDSRLERKKGAKEAELKKAVLTGQTKPAEGIGGEPVTTSGTPIKKEDKARSLGQKIGSGVVKATRSMLGFAKGGRITKNGIAFVHRGETIIPASKERTALRVSTRRSSRR
jgi:hypothetical protein